MVLDLAVAIALGGDCLADVAVLRAQPELFGAVASDPTISRLIDTLGDDSATVITAIRAARAGARAKVWAHRTPVPISGPVVVDLDATLVGAHSEKEGATANFKRGFGFHPMLAFVDHGAGGTGEPLVGMLRPGRANANDAADQIAVLDAALAQLPEQAPLAGAGARRHRLGGAGVRCGTSTTWGWSTRWGSTPANPSGRAGRAAPTGLASGTGRRRQPPRRRPGRRADPMAAGHLHRLATGNAGDRPPGTSPPRRPAAHHRPPRLADHRVRHQHPGGRLADLEVRHRLRARAEDRIRGLKDTGLTNLPLQAFAKNQIWLELVQLAAELLTWTQLLAWHDQPARTWEPKRLRLRLLAVAGTAHHHRPPTHPAPLPTMALGRPHHQRPPPPGPADLT